MGNTSEIMYQISLAKHQSENSLASQRYFVFLSIEQRILKEGNFSNCYFPKYSVSHYSENPVAIIYFPDFFYIN